MPRRHRADCPHERRPGMAVCLHCLHADRVAAQERRQRFLIRAAIGVITLTVVAAAASAGLGALQNGGKTVGTTRAAQRGSRKTAPKVAVAMTTAPAAGQAPVRQQGATDSALARPHASGATTSTAIAPLPVDSATHSAVQLASGSVPPAVAPSAATAAPVPIVPQGRTELPDSLFVVRTGDTVTVHFDTSPTRTRRADKFDRIVRQTLRAVYGAAADAALASVPEGALASPGDLLSELPVRGIHLQAAAGWRLSLWPETRPGRDGPLVIAYRVVAGR